MDVRLPDGTVVRNVPDNMSQADLTAKLIANGYDANKLKPPDAVPNVGDGAFAAEITLNLVAGLLVPIPTFIPLAVYR